MGNIRGYTRVAYPSVGNKCSVNHSMQNLIYSALFTNQISHTCGENCVANYDCVIRNKAKEITSKIEIKKDKKRSMCTMVTHV